MESFAMKQPGIPGRTFSRTFCPGSTGTIVVSFLSGHFPGHFVRKGWTRMKSDRRPIVLPGPAPRQFSRQSVASPQPGSPESRQKSRHFGEMTKSAGIPGILPFILPKWQDRPIRTIIQTFRAFEVIREQLALDPDAKGERWGLKCFPEKPEAPVNPPRPQADRVSPIQEETTVRQPKRQDPPG
jgi:hypothetical protein